MTYICNNISIRIPRHPCLSYPQFTEGSDRSIFSCKSWKKVYILITVLSEYFSPSVDCSLPFRTSRDWPQLLLRQSIMRVSFILWWKWTNCLQKTSSGHDSWRSLCFLLFCKRRIFFYNVESPLYVGQILIVV